MTPYEINLWLIFEAGQFGYRDRAKEIIAELLAAGPQESAPFPGECGEPAGLLARIAAQQAKIDQLMLEYCPEEMTAGQLAEWGRNQKDIGENA